MVFFQGGSLKKTSMAELNWDHIVTEPEHLLELKAYCCEECGYTLFPARGTADSRQQYTIQCYTHLNRQ